MLKRTSIYIGIIMLLAVGSILAQPKMTIPQAEFDFGYVPQNSKVSHTYWLHSTGTETLKIKQVKPGCGCTKAPLTKDILSIGDSTGLEVIYSTKTYRGKQSKRPSITTNSGAEPDRVSFSANVMIKPDDAYPILIKPYKFDISQFGEAERNKLKFTIENVSDETVEITVVDMPASMFKLKLPHKIKPGKTEKGEIEILSEFLDQDFEKSMTIELSDNQKTRFTIPIKRNIRIPGVRSEL